jgi:uncharacterized protein YkwD
MMKKSTAWLMSCAIAALAGCGGGQEEASGGLGREYSAAASASGQRLSSSPDDAAVGPSMGASVASMQKQSALWAEGAPMLVDTADREAVRRLYVDVYREPQVAAGWNGNYLTGNAGSINLDFQRSMLNRINWYRAMAGVPASVPLSATNSAKAQQAAFMMSANNALSHYPTKDWKFYTAEAAEAAAASNIGLGKNGPSAIDSYMRDSGENNGPVGHRRWLLFPNTRSFGVGDVPGETVNGQKLWGGTAVWVLDADFYGPRQKVRDGFVAWPTRGFVPHETVYARWSFTYPGADFSRTSVAVQRNGMPLDVKMEAVSTGAGDNTVVWQVPGIDPAGFHVKPSVDTKYQVTVSNVIIDQQPRSFTYEVVVFDAGPVLRGVYSSYTITYRDALLTLMDNTGREGTQTVKNPHRVDFADVSLAFDFEGNAGKAYRLYRAAFNRKPDANGLGFWIYAMDRGQALKLVAREFSQSAEFATLYGRSPSNAQILRALYLNVLHREPDEAGSAYWMRALENGLSVEQILIDFSESAENKLQVAGEINSGILYKRFGQ